MLRYGIVSTLIWHYTVDAVLIGTFLFQAESMYFRLSGVVVAGAIMLPLAVSVMFYKKNGGFLTGQNMLNATPPATAPLEPESEPGLEPEAVRDTPGEPVPAKWPVRWLYIAAAAALVVGLMVKPFQFGDFMDVRISATEAADIADDALGEKNLDPASWRRTVQFSDNFSTADFEYIRRIEGPQAANQTVRDCTFTGIWYARYFRPQQSEEWRVFINQQGRAYRIDHVLDENGSGENLTTDDALKIAETHLEIEQQQHLEDYQIVDSEQEKLDNRTDHGFVWEDNEFLIGEARARLSISVVGDEVSYYRAFLKLPEAWLREFHRPRLQGYIVPSIAGAIAMPLLIVFIRRLGSRSAQEGHHYRWKSYLFAGAVAAVMYALSAANEWPSILAGYNTAKPLENYLAQALLSTIVMILLIGLGVFLLALAADVFLQSACGYRTLPKPSLARSAAIAVLTGGLLSGLMFAEQLVPGDRYSLPLWNLASPASYSPALAVISGSLLIVLVLLCVLVVITSAASRYLKSRKDFMLIAVIVALVAVGQSTNIMQWVFYFFEGAVVIGLVLFLIRTCGFDLISFSVALFWLLAARSGLNLAAQTASALKWNGIFALVAAGIIGTGIMLYLKNLSRDSK